MLIFDDETRSRHHFEAEKLHILATRPIFVTKNTLIKISENTFVCKIIKWEVIYYGRG